MLCLEPLPNDPREVADRMAEFPRKDSRADIDMFLIVIVTSREGSACDSNP